MATSLETFGSLNIEWNESTTRAITECRDALTMLDELQGEFDDLNNPDGAADVLPALRLTRETVARHLREHNELEERIAELELYCTSVDKLLALQVARHHEAVYLEQQSNLLLARQQYVAKYTNPRSEQHVTGCRNHFLSYTGGYFFFSQHWTEHCTSRMPPWNAFIQRRG